MSYCDTHRLFFGKHRKINNCKHFPLPINLSPPNSYQRTITIKNPPIEHVPIRSIKKHPPIEHVPIQSIQEMGTDVLYEDDNICILHPDSERGIVVYHHFSSINVLTDGLKTGLELHRTSPGSLQRSTYHPYSFFELLTPSQKMV